MFDFLSFILIASLATYLSIAILRPIAQNNGLIDLPNKRKMHDGEVPLVGGLAMFIGVLLSFFLNNLINASVAYFLSASLIIIVIGVIDDYRTLSVKLRILFQFIASFILIYFAEVNIVSIGNLLGHGEIYLNSWSIFFTLLAYIAGINALNMSDGMHGLAGGSCLITFSSIIFLAFLDGSLSSSIISILFCAVIPIFLLDNLCIFRSNEYRIFMGDAGSMFLGLAVAFELIGLSQVDVNLFSPVTALWIFSVPLFDLVFTISRRLITGNSPFKPDSSHLHHVLQKYGFSAQSTLVIILLTSLLMAIIGILGEVLSILESTMFVSFLFLFFLFSLFMCYGLKEKT